MSDPDDIPYPFKPMPVPAGIMREIEPRTDKDGRVIRRYVLSFLPDGPIYEECRMTEPIAAELVQVQPLPEPQGKIFYMETLYKQPDGCFKKL